MAPKLAEHSEIKLALARRRDRSSFDALQFQPAHAEQGIPLSTRERSKKIGSMRMRLLTLREVAQYLRVHPGTVYRLVKAGHLRAARLGRDLRFDIRVLDEWIAQGGTSNSESASAHAAKRKK